MCPRRETSDLVYCVADLQFSNHKLQEDVRKLKQAMEAMEDTNLRLAEENEQLRSQAKMYTHTHTLSLSHSHTHTHSCRLAWPLYLMTHYTNTSPHTVQV